MARSPFYMQETLNSCSVACMRTVLALQFSIRIPESVLRFIGDRPDRRLSRRGTAWPEWRRMLAQANASRNPGLPWTTWRRRHGTGASLAKLLSQGRYPIACVTTHDYHAVVILEVRADAIVLWDPDPSTPRTPGIMPMSVFLSYWHNGAGLREYEVIGGGTLNPTLPSTDPYPVNW